MVTIKSPAEIESMKKAGAIVRDVLNLMRDSVRPGVTTGHLDKLAYDSIRSQHAVPSFLHYNGFPASICASVDDMIIHGIPSDDVVIREGQIVSIDVGVYYNGFHGDAARTFLIGAVSPEKQKLVEVTKECFFRAVGALGDGTPLGDVGYAVQSYAEENGFSVVREYVGHGVGHDMHEDPAVPNYGKKGTGIRVKRGMTIAIEPMINMGTRKTKLLSDGWGVKTLDGMPSAHYENTVAITEDGVEILTL